MIVILFALSAPATGVEFEIPMFSEKVDAKAKKDLAKNRSNSEQCGLDEAKKSKTSGQCEVVPKATAKNSKKTKQNSKTVKQ